MGTGIKGKANTFLFGVVIMAIILCFGSDVQAAQEGDYSFDVLACKAHITGYSGSGGNITVPAVLGEAPVTSIGDRAFSGCTGITSIVIPEGVTMIGEGAFSGCKGLKNITLPQSLTIIGDLAFEDCIGLTRIVIPKGAALIGEDTFKGCTNLTSISHGAAPATIYKQAFRRIMTRNNGYSQIEATLTLPAREKAEDLNITYNNGSASYSYFGCQRKESDGSGFDFEFGFGFKPCENKMMQFGIYYSLKAGSGENAIKEWRWLRPEIDNKKFYGFDYGTTHKIQLAAHDGGIKVSVRDEDDNLEYSGFWSFEGPVENGSDQNVRRVTSLLVPEDKSATAKNYTWTTTNVGADSTLKPANVSNCKATTSSSGDAGWIKVVTNAEFFHEKVSFDID